MNTLLALVLALLPIVQGSITVHQDSTAPLCGGGVNGFYNPTSNELHVCSGLSERHAQEVFAHELVHAAADAVDGINNSTLKPLLTNEQYLTLSATPRGQAVHQHIKENYEGAPAYVIRLEFEAWYAQSQLADILFE